MRLRQIFIAASVAALTSLTFAPIASANVLKPGVSDLITPGTLTNCVEIAYPPMEYFADGTSGDAIGFDIEAAAALATAWGVNIKHVNTSFEGLIPSLASKKCDIVWSALYLSNKRLQVADGVIYMNTGAGIVVPTGNPKKVTTAIKLCGLNVAVQGQGANWQILQDQSTACTSAGKKAVNVQSYPKMAQTVASLISGKSDALIETDVAVSEITNASSGKLMEARGVLKAKTQFAVYVSKKSPLYRALKLTVRSLILDGTLGKIAVKYGLDPKKLSTVKKPPL